MECLLHYVWKYKLYSPLSLVTTDGRPVQVIDCGLSNTDAGPDFFNAKVKIGDTLWAGSVEIHDKSSDWLRHHHDKDKAYDGVILHVVKVDDYQPLRTDGEAIPQLVLTVPDNVQRNIDWLLKREAAFPCQLSIAKIPSLHVTDWISALLCERLERKLHDIYARLDQSQEDWNEAFYITLTRNFGFGVNNDAFERLAKSLPLRIIRKQRGNPIQVEALFLGQSGMLEHACDDPYYQQLQREYEFLRHKYELQPLESFVFKNFRTRPVNFPFLKVAQLAALWTRYDTLFSCLLEARTPNEVRQFFRVPPSDYWKTHFRFGVTSSPQEKILGDRSINILLINTVVPMYFAYGKRNQLPIYSERAMRLLERIPPEKNSIVTAFERAGIVAQHAGDSQALIQLKREYCEKKKCLYCRIGYRMLRQSMHSASS